jgi:hypothetical protein
MRVSHTINYVSQHKSDNPKLLHPLVLCCRPREAIEIKGANDRLKCFVFLERFMDEHNVQRDIVAERATNYE